MRQCAATVYPPTGPARCAEWVYRPDTTDACYFHGKTWEGEYTFELDDLEDDE